jgi:hypothetical protein
MSVISIINARVMPLVKKRRNNQMPERAESPVHVRVSQQRGSADENIGCDYGSDRESSRKENDAYRNRVCYLADRVKPRCRKPVELFARMVNDVKCP